MPPQCDEQTEKAVFWVFHTTNFLLFMAIAITQYVLKKEDSFDLVTAQVFLYGALFTFLGAKAGGYLGAVMEEDACSQLDMGVLSSMGSFIGATIFGLLGTAMVGMYLIVAPEWMSVGIAILVLGIWIFHTKWRIVIQRLTQIDCCGFRLGPDGNRLPDQPMKMKNKLAILLMLTFAIEVFLTVLMVLVMKRDLANKWMLGGMMYGMGGAMLGGMLGGWLAGLLDAHTGEPEHDNPIMVCAMALMAGMMGGTAAGMVGGMMPLMGPVTMVPTFVLSLLLLVLCYFWFFQREFRLALSPRRDGRTVPWIGRILWQRQ